MVSYNPLGVAATVLIVIALALAVVVSSTSWLTKTKYQLSNTFSGVGPVTGSLKADLGLFRWCDTITTSRNGKSTSSSYCKAASSSNIKAEVDDSAADASWKATQAMVVIAFAGLLAGLITGYAGLYRKSWGLAVAGFVMATVGAAAYVVSLGTWVKVNQRVGDLAQDRESLDSSGKTPSTKLGVSYWLLLLGAICAVVGVGLGIPPVVAQHKA